MMDWSIRPPQTSNLQTENFQIQEPYLSQQLTAACDLSQTNASTQNSHTYPGNDQIIKMHSNTKSTIANQLPHQNTAGPSNFQPILPKTPLSTKNFGMTQQLVGTPPVSCVQLSSAIIQLPAQNSWPNPNSHISSPVAAHVNSVQNIPQKQLNQFVVPTVYGNHPQKHYSNSVRTSVYQQSGNSSSSKRQLTRVPYRHGNGPATSQAGTVASLNATPNHYLNSQQNLVFSSGQNIQNQTHGQSSRSAIIMDLAQYASGHVNPTQYAVPTHCDYRNVTQNIPQVVNINHPPPSYCMPPVYSVQHFQNPQSVQPVSNVSNGNIQNHQNPRLDQSSNLYSVQHFQKHQSVPIARETNEAGSTTHVSLHRDENQPSNELAKSSLEILDGLYNNIQIAGTVSSKETSTPQTSRTLVQEDNLTNGSGNLSDNIAKGRIKITKETLTQDAQDLRRRLRDFKMKHYFYKRFNRQTSDLTVHNQNSSSLISTPCNTNQPSSLPDDDANQACNFSSHDASWNQQFSPTSHGSSQMQGGPLPNRSKDHLSPILEDLLKGTIDEGMLLDIVKLKEHHRYRAAQENCSSGALVSNRDKLENSVNGIEKTSTLSPKASPDPAQKPLICTKNGPSSEKTFKNSGVDFKLNEDTMGMISSKILTSLQSSVQNPAVSNRSSHSVEKIVKESSGKSQCPKSVYPELLQQNKSTCLQTSEKNITTWNTENDSDTSSVAPHVSKAPAVVPEAGLIQKSSVPGNSGTTERTCSWEELETSLALWGQKLPTPLHEMFRENTGTTASLASSVGGDKTKHTLENLPNASTQNDQTKITVGTNEINSAPSSLGNKFDTVVSSFSKGSEPQVAIVTPLIQSKESTQSEVLKKNPILLKIICPIIEEGSLHSLQELNSTIPDADKGVGGSDFSPPDTHIAVTNVDSDVHQKAAKFTNENRIVKAEPGTNYSCDLNQMITGPSSFELKQIKSETSSGDNFPPEMITNCLNPVPQKGLEFCKSGPDLLEPGDLTATVQNDTVFQISSVCTLVEGDTSYNSQIASIFSTSLLKPSMTNNDVSEEHMPYPQSNKQQSDFLKSDIKTNVSTSEGDALLLSEGSLPKAVAEKLLLDLPVLGMHQSGEISGDMNITHSEEEKSNCVPEGTPILGKKHEQENHCVLNTDLASDNSWLSGKEEGVFSTDPMKENTQEHMPTEDNGAHNMSNIEPQVTLLNDQLTELLKEFPDGINASEVFKKTEIKDSIFTSTEREDKEDIRTCGKNPNSSGGIDQIKITILNSQQRKEYFPEHSFQSSKKLKNCENDKFVHSEYSLRENNISSVKSDQALYVDSKNSTAETIVKKENCTYCCLPGWIASDYGGKPCSCMLAKDLGLKQQEDLQSQSKTIFKEKTKVSEDYRADHKVNNHLQISITLPLDATSQSLKTDRVESKKRYNQTYIREDLPTDKVRFHSNRNNLKRVAERPLSKMELSDKERTLRERLMVKSKADPCRRRSMEIKHSKKYERFKIKRDSSETHMIKGPTYKLSKGLKRRIEKGKKHAALEIQHSAATNPSNLNSVGIVSERSENPWQNPTLHARELLKKWKCEKSKKDREKNHGIKKVEHSESNRSEHAQDNKGSIKRINLNKFAYSRVREYTWNCKNSLIDNSKTLKVQKQRYPFNMPKSHSPGKGTVQAARNRDEQSAQSLSDKNAPFNRITIPIQREQSKSYLSKVSVTNTAQQCISLKKIDLSPSKSIGRMKSSSVLSYSEDQRTSRSAAQQPKGEKPQMLEFKICPEILFGKSVSEEHILDAEKPEKGRTPITALKSKREAWLNYSPVKRRKMMENLAQVKLLEGNEDLRVPVRDSQATFQTYRKMHLAKRSRSLDSNSTS
ncbi:retroelement silencing factor 1 isoform X2 [Hemicordylus capensis]|uniref:retroelement silencing factor 1 isoform X2 n=1 Tax=Hemicordylus capensis TaxID=884348 RepID=UPI002303AFF1|nr:retroelement silencing factor 1 isoform X2 [Hemicordylus capensis]